MKKLNLIIFTILICFLQANAQKGGPVVFTVGSDTVWGAEFERVYSKNNRSEEKPSLADLEAYRELYIKFKLKVKEAYAMGMDTNAAFQKELAGYRKQLAKPYLTDKEVNDRLINEAYERMKTEVDASNLMVYVSELASPKDTAEALARIEKWYRMITEEGIDFAQLAADSSQDEYGRKYKGRLGYFTAFNMIYPFENVAYSTEVGAVSRPFRTQYGYHILKVNAKRPARGEVKVAHILIRRNNDAEIAEKKLKIDAIYERLKKGENWDDLVMQFTEDFTSRTRGGELGWVSSIGGNFPEAIREAAFKLEKDGALSEPVLSEMGWHILMRLEKRGVRPLKDMEEFLKFKISKDSRSQLNQIAVIKRIKEENKYTENRANIDGFLRSLDSSILNNTWKASSMHSTEDELFRIAGKKYTYSDFSKYISSYKNADPKADLNKVRMDMFRSYSDNANLDYEESILEEKYDDFKYLMQEYRDGILLFELTNKLVWNKASEDTSGLENFFEANRDKYLWKKRLAYRAYHCSDSKTAKTVKKMLKKGNTDAEMLAAVNANNPLALRIDQKVVEQGSDETVDHLDWNKKITKIKDGSKNKVYIVTDSILPAGRKELRETLGPVTSDYQDHLENQWIESLKLKYPVVLNEKALPLLFDKKK
ncbi:MAG: peptidylprolyl isomerase [Flavobacteriales bacterium]|nr:peptidylprolyl isomerase [Flavobacteriales bacterium]